MNDAAFRRLLRWYPRAWRDQHGEILLSTLLDVAEIEQRAAPTRAEARDAALRGTAARLDRRFAVVAALAAAALSIAAGVIAAWGVAPGILGLLLSTGAPALASASLIAALRLRGWLSDSPALAALAASTVAWALNGLTALSWALGFDASDAGSPAPPLAVAWLPLLAAAIVTGACAIAIVVEPVLRRARLPLVGRLVIGGAGGAVLAPLIGLSTFSPVTAGAAAAAATFLAVKQRTSSTRPEIRPPSVVNRRARERHCRAARPLAVVAAVGGVVGLAYAVSGQSWSAGAVDGTIAMAHGITLMAVSAVPLLGALVVLATARSRAGVVGPAVLAALGCGALALAYVRAPDSEAMWPLLQVSAAAIGAAIAWWLIPRIGMSPSAAVTIGLITGLLYAAFLGLMIGPLLTFGVPVTAAALALRPRARRGPDAAVAGPALTAR